MLPAGDAIYVQVDSASAGNEYGAVLELHKLLGERYNHVSGPHRGEGGGSDQSTHL